MLIRIITGDGRNHIGYVVNSSFQRIMFEEMLTNPYWQLLLGSHRIRNVYFC